MISRTVGEPGNSLAEDRVTAVYQVSGSEAEARAKANLICVDQTVEASEEVLTPHLRARPIVHAARFSDTLHPESWAAPA